MQNYKLKKMANYKNTENQVGKSGLFNHNTPKEGGIRDIHQKRKKSKESSKASNLEMQKTEQYQDQSIIDKSFEASDAYQEARQTRGENKGWSERKMERKGLDSGVGDVVKDIRSSGIKAGEKRVPKYTAKGELIGYKVKPGGGKGSTSTSKPKEEDAQYFSSNKSYGNTSWDLWSGKEKRQHVRSYKKGKHSGNLIGKEVDLDMKKAAENIKIRDTFTRKGRHKLRSFYMQHDPTAKSEYGAPETTTNIYSDDDSVSDISNTRTRIKGQQTWDSSMYPGKKSQESINKQNKK